MSPTGIGATSVVGLTVGLVVLVLLLVGLATFVFIRQRKNCSCNTKREEESTDENPVYATYEVRDDSVAEVKDSNTYYSRGDAYGENSVRTQVRDNNSQYMFA